MAGKKRSATDSLAKLSRGLTRETPVTRVVTTTESDGGRGEGTRDSTVPDTVGAPEEPTRRQKTGRPRTKPQRMVRVSVDLPRSYHKYLRDFAYDAESDGMSVMRALLEEMRADEDLAERIFDRLARK